MIEEGIWKNEKFVLSVQKKVGVLFNISKIGLNFLTTINPEQIDTFVSLNNLEKTDEIITLTNMDQQNEKKKDKQRW